MREITNKIKKEEQIRKAYTIEGLKQGITERELSLKQKDAMIQSAKAEIEYVQSRLDLDKPIEDMKLYTTPIMKAHLNRLKVAIESEEYSINKIQEEIDSATKKISEENEEGEIDA